MKYFSVAVRITRTLAIALWVGAMAGFAFFFAPIAFHTIGPTAAFAATIAASVRATTSFGWGCAVVAFVATLILPERKRRGSIALLGALVAMAGLSFFEVSSIIPKMEHTALQTPAYDALHRQSSRVYGTVLLLGILSLGLISVRNERPGQA